MHSISFPNTSGDALRSFERRKWAKWRAWHHKRQKKGRKVIIFMASPSWSLAEDILVILFGFCSTQSRDHELTKNRKGGGGTVPLCSLSLSVFLFFSQFLSVFLYNYLFVSHVTIFSLSFLLFSPYLFFTFRITVCLESYCFFIYFFFYLNSSVVLWFLMFGDLNKYFPFG